MNPDDLLAQINFELTNLNRDHVYYSVDEQPKVCTRLIAQGIRGGKSSGNIMDDMTDGLEQLKEAIEEKIRPIAEEFIHRVSVTVQSWDDIPAAIGLIKERRRDFKKRNNL